MDGQRFDNLTKRLAAGTSRRAVLKGLAAGLLGGLTGTEAAAQRARGQPIGAACTSAADCASAFCATGVCCDIPCTGQCESCATGTCQPVTGAPELGRQPCPGDDPCQASCDGITSDACTTFPGAETPCGEATCIDGWQTTYACAGNGSCAPTTTSCAPFGCSAEGADCASGCTSDADCAPGSYCGDSGQCLPDEGLGTPCAADTDCQHGFCVDAVCCVERCGACQVCDLPGNEGFCGPATDGGACDGGTCCGGECVDTASDVAHCGACDVACAGDVCQVAVCDAGVCGTAPMPDDTSCGEGQVCTDGACGCPGGLTACDGTCVDTQTDQQHCGDCTTVCPEAAVCRMPACAEGQCTTEPDPDQAGHTCADATCVDGQQTTAACDAAGNCAETTTACGLYRCNADGTACLTNCQDNGDCQDTTFCNAQGACQGDKADDEPCTGNDECVSGRCVDDICVAACGSMGQPCCPGDTPCHGSYLCDANNICQAQACGARGQPCCPPDDTCHQPYSFCTENGICEACGHAYEPCCPGNTCLTGDLYCDAGNTCQWR